MIKTSDSKTGPTIFQNVKHGLFAACAGTMFLTAGCSSHQNNDTALISSSSPQNPLLAEWTGPYGGTPPFDQVEIAHFKPALETAMENNLSEIDSIASIPEPPTFENTILALELSGRQLDRVMAVYGVWGSTMNDSAFSAVELEMEPKLSAFYSKIMQHGKLFERIEAVYNSPEKEKLDPEQQRLVWLYHTNYVRAGAKLDSASKARVAEINQELAGLFTQFSQNVLADESNRYLTITNENDLSGLPQSLIDAAKDAAQAKGVEGWVVSNTRSAIEPFLTYADNRELRKQAHELFTKRGDMGGEQDNNAIITHIMQLRQERAKLLGYETHAHWRMENTMAGTPERAMELMQAVWKPATQRVKEEVRDMQALAKAEGQDIAIEPWDYRYYAEKVRKQRYDLDENQVKPYLQLDSLVKGMFWTAGELFNLDFEPVNDVPVYHPDVRTWKVNDKTSGEFVGLFYFDPYAREGKRSGAWMNDYRSQHEIGEGQQTIVSNNSNFIKGKAGEAVLISWEDATTLFHEFGHALHGLASDVTYPSLAGTSVARDYVEFPSQLLEHWLATPELLNRYAVHYQTGEPIPQDLVAKIERAATFNEGFATTEYLICALVDMKMHMDPSGQVDPKVYEEKALAELGMPHEIVMRHRLPQFLHLFSSDSYSAGYYSYLWSDVLTADAYEAFTEAGGPYDKQVGKKLNDYIFSSGNTNDPAASYKNFRGRDPKTEALMRKRGFPVGV